MSHHNRQDNVRETSISSFKHIYNLSKGVLYQFGKFTPGDLGPLCLNQIQEICLTWDTTLRTSETVL